MYDEISMFSSVFSSTSLCWSSFSRLHRFRSALYAQGTPHYLLPQALNNVAYAAIPEGMLSPEDFEAEPLLQQIVTGFINSIKGRLPRFTIIKTIVTKDPFIVLNILRFIRGFYERQVDFCQD
ncbi:hypothetical protein [Parasitella parasitica]|uniref:Uncharacterized protein n=1 Tax=Parasitella parasitica TaxID=35722 RepID=A0A0B7NQZ8_9FUNG|nr:hypothetical protein [Parasitella parasitica]